MKSQVAMATAAKGDAIIQHMQTWYNALWKGLSALHLTADRQDHAAAFCDAVQKLADQTAKDPDIKKYTRTM